MGSKPQHCPSFFKVLLNDFAHKLSIPRAFVKQLKWQFPCTQLLKTECGGSWEVEIKELGHKICFVDGWHEFVNFHKLEECDFLVFRLMDDSVFQVTIFDPSCCEKEPHPPLLTNTCDTQIVPTEIEPKCNTSCYKTKNVDNEMETDSDDDEPKAYPSRKIEDPCFVTSLKVTCKKNLFLPNRFVGKTGLGRKTCTVLRDSRGKVWPVTVKIWTKHRVHLTHGWPDFVRANRLKEGDTCLFKYKRNEGNLIQVMVLKKSGDQNK